jgi:toxin-antitoxin system PIN domain toxin
VSFIDTNVLVYATAAGSPFHVRAREALARLASTDPFAISRQVLREYLAVTTRPQVWARPLALAEALTDTDSFSRRFTILEDGLPVWEQLALLGRRFSFGGRQVHDANIVATMLAHGETRLLTFNDVDFRRFSSVIEIVVP